MSYKLLSEMNKPKDEAVEPEAPVKKAVVEYNILTQVNESAHEEEEYNILVEKVIAAFGFDRDEVICSDEDAEEFMQAVKQCLVAEQGGERAGVARAGAREWMRDLAGREEEGGEYGGSKLGLTAGKETPKVGERVLLGRVPTKISGVDRAPGGSVDAVSVPVGKVELIVPRDALLGPKILGNETLWMVSKENAQKLIDQWKQRNVR